MRRILIYWWQAERKVKVAEIAERRGSPIMLEWDKKFLNTELELSPIKFSKKKGVVECPAQPFDGLPGFLADQLPDGWGRILLKRGLRDSGILGDELSPLDAMAYIGDRAMGALSFEPALRGNEQWGTGEVSLSDLERGVEPILDGEASSVIGAFLESGASPHGVRPKILLKEKDGTFFSGVENLNADEWLIKFRSPEDPKDIGKVEYIYSQIAKSAGLRVPETRLFKSGKKFFFGSKRFDRSAGERFHLHTLSGLLHAAPGNFSVGYDHFARVTSHLTRDMRELEQVFRIAVFNTFACNQDDHSRNVAFLMDGAGHWQVAPAYDLTFYRTSSGEHKMGVDGNGQLTEGVMVNFGQSIGIKKSLVKEIISKTKEEISRFPKLARELDVHKNEVKRVWSNLEKGVAAKKDRGR